jgi:hypothetical protein
MAGFSNDGNFLAKFLATQQKLGVVATGAVGAPPAAAAAAPVPASHHGPLPNSGWKASPASAPHAPFTRAPQWGAPQSAPGWGVPHQVRTIVRVSLHRRVSLLVVSMPDTSMVPRDVLVYSKQHTQLPWQTAPRGAVRQNSALRQTALAQPQTKSEQLAAAGWSRIDTPEGSWWSNEVTGATSASEPEIKGGVMLVHKATGGQAQGLVPVAAGMQGQVHPDPASALPSPLEEQPADSRALAPPPPPGVSKQAAAVMEKLAARVTVHGGGEVRSKENGEKFETMLRQKNQGDPTFSFLFHVGSVGHAYYETLKRFRGDIAGVTDPCTPHL